MKNLIYSALLIALLIACNKEDHTLNSSGSELIGAWKLEAVYVSPGGGQVEFEQVESNKIIVFQDDGTLSSNGDLCSMSPDSDDPTSGTYSVVDSTFQSPDCYYTGEGPNYWFNLENNVLIIHYPCICPCQAKFKKFSLAPFNYF